MIPNKDLFIVTSAIHTSIGVVQSQDRLNQTLQGLKTLREKAPNALILLAETSVKQLEPDILNALSQYTNVNLIFTGDQDLMSAAEQGRKSEAEVMLLHKTLFTLKNNVELSKILSSIRRIHKLSGRTDIIDGFNPDVYSDDKLFGKYVFKKRIPSWMPEHQQKSSGADHLYITRMYSFCMSLFDDYYATLPLIYRKIGEFSIDTEHSHFASIDKSKVVEFDNLYCQGMLAGNGQVEVY